MNILNVIQATEMSFRLMDVVFIGSGLLTIAGLYWKQVNNSSKADVRMSQIETNANANEKQLKEDLLNAKNSRKSIRKESIEGDKETLKIANARIDIVKGDLKEQAESNKIEFKEINEKLGLVSGDTSEIKGMLTNFLNKQ